jgi:hypothetical protein
VARLLNLMRPKLMKVRNLQTPDEASGSTMDSPRLVSGSNSNSSPTHSHDRASGFIELIRSCRKSGHCPGSLWSGRPRTACSMVPRSWARLLHKLLQNR